jgi:hypothetical protein
VRRPELKRLLTNPVFVGVKLEAEMVAEIDRYAEKMPIVDGVVRKRAAAIRELLARGLSDGPQLNSSSKASVK